VLKLSLDVTSIASMDAALAAALDRFGRIDVLNNNAGRNTWRIAEALPEEVFREIMETNFWGPVHLMRKAVGTMRDVNATNGGIGGCVVNVTSMGGRFAIAGSSPYHSSKFALEGFTETIAGEVYSEWGIKIMLLELGGTKSKFVSQSMEGTGPGHVKYNNKERMVNVLLEVMKGLGDPEASKSFAEAEDVARCLFDVLNGEEVPLRLFTGRDAYKKIKRKEGEKTAEMEKWREVSDSVGGVSVDL
jgi:NAD(P)-dependent dehydrogenase (short-subunit alcohol dehydrogenase family)